LANFASSLQASQSDLSTFGHRFSRAVKTGNWDDYSKGLELLTQRITEPPAPANQISLVDPAPSVISNSAPISLVDISAAR
jgi:hypothetical protein